jgi:hypothetical protein
MASALPRKRKAAADRFANLNRSTGSFLAFRTPA